MATAILTPELREGKIPFYATFGTGHAHPGCYYKIWCEREDQARAIMCKFFHNRWGFIYKDQTSAGIIQYGLKNVREIVINS